MGKRIIISISILLLVVFCIDGVLSGAEDPDSSPAAKTDRGGREKAQEQEKWTAGKYTADANLVIDPNDPNSPRRRRRKRWYEDLELALEKLDRENQQEIRDWMEIQAERRIRITNRIYDRITGEFNLVRDVAVKEGAVETVKAVDLVLKSREERITRILNRMEEARETIRSRGGRDDADRDRGRRGRERRGRGRDDRYRRSRDY